MLEAAVKQSSPQPPTFVQSAWSRPWIALTENDLPCSGALVSGIDGNDHLVSMYPLLKEVLESGGCCAVVSDCDGFQRVISTGAYSWTTSCS